MINIAKVISLNEYIEEEATLSINNTDFTSFVYTPYHIEINKQYPVEISLYADEIVVFDNTTRTKSLERVNDSFEYIINGFLNYNGYLDVGFLINDDMFEEFKYLSGTFVSLKVERINAEFIITE